jgi:hypothetical protein
MTYGEKLHEVAQEMACNYWNANKSNAALRFEQLSSDIQRVQIDKMLTTARIAVRLQAEAVRYALIKHSDILSKEENAYLIEVGLIPFVKTHDHGTANQ